MCFLVTVPAAHKLQKHPDKYKLELALKPENQLKSIKVLLDVQSRFSM